MIETVVCTLDISNSFTEFADRFDHEEAAGREAKGIKVLYRGVCRENPSKVVIIVQAETGVISRHMQENTSRFMRNGALMDTAVATAYQEGC
ncbi:hypothetical protein SynBIOSE41_01049 [Synechococcus sp. BIOS-E4-1]|uniref:DUF3764 family protein n=1 Tax=Synechococcus sp. BIOS-E4-1 TaxID=1400864 RepID=UPI001646D158|nr:DUF3764 family protein [Synechococcus sp. BIOS-E4-1]QNI53573.1 hypothetical protein SynBIOSE41_01049 [Synechococcus sp. BIOS-E4-1]